MGHQSNTLRTPRGYKLWSPNKYLKLPNKGNLNAFRFVAGNFFISLKSSVTQNKSSNYVAEGKRRGCTIYNCSCKGRTAYATCTAKFFHNLLYLWHKWKKLINFSIFNFVHHLVVSDAYRIFILGQYVYAVSYFVCSIMDVEPLHCITSTTAAATVAV